MSIKIKFTILCTIVIMKKFTNLIKCPLNSFCLGNYEIYVQQKQMISR